MIIERGVRGLNEAVAFAEQRAKHYAPVRHIFQKQPGPRGTEFQRGGSKGQGASGGVQTRTPVYIRTASAMKSYLGSRPHERRFINPGDSQRVGHSNSFEPLFDTGLYQHSGDFRRVVRRKEDGGVYKLANVNATTLSPSGSDNHQMSGADFVSGRGRYEIEKRPFLHPDEPRKSSIFESPEGGHVTIGGDTIPVSRVGGRLRGEIYSIPADASKATRTGVIWAYVVSPTEYAKHQEFGTRHNRAHPFLRPALYDSRRYLGEAVRRSVAGGRRYQTSGGTRGLSERHGTIGGSSLYGGGGSAHSLNLGPSVGARSE